MTTKHYSARVSSTNNFNRDDLLKWFDGWYKCFLCGQNTWDCFHHAVGRGIKNDNSERSILNAIPLCNNKCHLPEHGKLRTKEFASKFLKQSYEHLLEQGYEFTELDEKFLEKYSDHYI